MKHTSNLTRLDLNRICYAIGVHRHWQCLKDLLALCNISSKRYSWTYLNYQQNQCLSPLTFWIGTTYVVSSNPAKDDTTSDKVSRFPPPINWPPRYNPNIVESGVKHPYHNRYFSKRIIRKQTYHSDSFVLIS